MIKKNFITFLSICLIQFFSNSSYSVEPDEILQNQKQDLRIIIRNKIKKGHKDHEIYEFLTDRYGDFILLKPPFKLNTIALWLLPFIFFIIGVLILFSHNKKSR